MDGRIPIVLFGDGPRLSSGLGRIAKDLAVHLVAREEALGIRLVQVGVDYPSGWHWQPWDFYGFQPEHTDQGRGAVRAVVDELREAYGTRPIVLMIMDPSRCFDLVRAPRDDRDAPIDAEWWGYFPLDSHNPTGGIGGPAAQAVAGCDRLLAYGRYGAGVLKQTLGGNDRTEPGPPIQYLPHGLDLRVWRPVPLEQAHPGFQAWARDRARQLDSVRIGCVATNQPRKDLGLLFAAVANLKQRGHPVALWLHTDEAVKAWALSELVSTFAFHKDEVAVSLMDPAYPMPDEQLAAQYSWSDVTLAPGLGEGFGYPIVESLACGTPVVHGRYAGGVELIPKPAWLVEPVAWRLESVYTVQRPVFHPEHVAAALLQAAMWKQEQPGRCRAYCTGAVAHLDWQYLWPRWESWFKHGFDAHRQREGAKNGTRGARESVQSVSEAG